MKNNFDLLQGTSHVTMSSCPENTEKIIKILIADFFQYMRIRFFQGKIINYTYVEKETIRMDDFQIGAIEKNRCEDYRIKKIPNFCNKTKILKSKNQFNICVK
ncbi:hypothetical protein BpHYR1_013823 [Brachionus plicatilis]|uniref:Uncharacterized protein n=1 Tax=Brachionus plicatilis TaxID=10195 RepID=A0A3M7SWX8_BRAPC|nr:hypothetical protein BpHYR1_013823 [Brachionus plicatilis]